MDYVKHNIDLRTLLVWVIIIFTLLTKIMCDSEVEDTKMFIEEDTKTGSEEDTASRIEVVQGGVRIPESFFSDESSGSRSEGTKTSTISEEDTRTGSDEDTASGREISDESSGCRSEETTTTTTIKTTTAKVIILPKGPFYNFLVNICNTLLTKFYYRKIPSFLTVLRKSLKGLGPQYLMRKMIEKFRRRLKQLSRYNGKLLKVKILQFLNIISSGDPMMNDFFYAMNDIYNVAADNKMDNYVYDLLRYGKTTTRHIGDRTRETFVKLIFGTFYKQREEVQKNIELKFKLAVVEYMEKHKSIRKPLSELNANDLQAMKLIYSLKS